MQSEGLADGDTRLEAALDMRYVGQSYEITVPVGGAGSEAQETPAMAMDAALERFHAMHEARFGHRHPAEPVEIVNLRLKAIGRADRLAVSAEPVGEAGPAAALVGRKAVCFEGSGGHGAQWYDATLYERERLRPGNVITGPAVVFQLDATTVIPPRWRAVVDGYRNLVVELTR